MINDKLEVAVSPLLIDGMKERQLQEEDLLLGPCFRVLREFLVEEASPDLLQHLEAKIYLVRLMFYHYYFNKLTLESIPTHSALSLQ